MSQLKFPLTGAHRAGEGAFFMSEELTLDQLFRNGRAVDSDKGPVSAGGEFVNGLRDQFFSGSSITLDEDRDIRGRCLLHGHEDLFHFRRFSQDLEPWLQCAGQTDVFLDHLSVQP